jgi:HK97 family phage prohead protease
MKAKEREYRAIVSPFQIQSNEKRIDSDFYVEGYATTFDKPYLLYEYDGIKYYEVIDRNALDGADMSDVIFQLNHEGKVYARQSNKSLILQPDNHGLFVCADLGKTASARGIFEEIQSELITKMSWAFTVAEESYNTETRTRTILKIKKIYDVSAVSIPANQDTEINARSFIDGVIEKEKQELLERNNQLKLAKAKFNFMEVK